MIRLFLQYALFWRIRHNIFEMRRLFRSAFRRWITPSFLTSSMALSSFRKSVCQKDEDLQQEVQATMSKIFFSPDQCEYTDLKIFSLNADDLCRQITSHLDISMGRLESSHFNDGEISMQVHDSVSGHKVFLVKSFAGQKINEGIMQVILAVSSMKKSGASNIVVILPYFPYSKVESSLADQTTVNTFFAADFAKLLESVGCDLIVTVNAQHREVKGFTDQIPFISIDVTELVVPYLIHQEIENPILVGSSLNPYMSKQLNYLKSTFQYFDLNCDLGFYYSDDGYIGKDIKGRDVILFENILRTGQKLKHRANDLKAKGARSIYAFAIHGLTQAPQLQKLVQDLPVKQLILTNTIQQYHDNSKLRYISISKYLAEMISLIDCSLSLSAFRSERSILKMAFVEKIRRYAASGMYNHEEPHMVLEHHQDID